MKNSGMRGALVALIALVTIFGTDSVAVARPHRPPPDGAGSVATLLGPSLPARHPAPGARQMPTDDGIVSESLWATGVSVPADGCGEASYGMTLVAGGPTPVASWDATATVTAPDGTEASWGSLSNYSTSDTVFLCAGIDLAGTYTVSVDWTAYDASFLTVDQGSDAATFTFSVAPAPHQVRQRLKVHRYKWGRHGWRVTGTLTRGGHRRAHVKVYVDALIGGYGYDLFSARTNRHGVATWRFRPKKGAGRFKLALYVYEDATSTDAWSRTFRLPHR